MLRWFSRSSLWLIVYLLTALNAAELLYLEAQGLVAYHNRIQDTQYYSMSSDDVMQKPTIGFDYINKLQDETGDLGTLAIQGRLAWKNEQRRTESQLYNAYYKTKSGFWIGHNRPALGLSSYIDSHGLLMPLLPMYGIGYDRDWGVGYAHDSDNGNFAFSYTSGSGMGWYSRGNYLTSMRYGLGVLADENYTVGVSLAGGKTLATMGYVAMGHDPMPTALAGVDGAWYVDNQEYTAELVGGKKEDLNFSAALARQGIKLLEEGNLKLEVQEVATKYNTDIKYFAAAGFSWQFSSATAWRMMYNYDYTDKAYSVVGQLYYYGFL